MKRRRNSFAQVASTFLYTVIVVVVVVVVVAVVTAVAAASFHRHSTQTLRSFRRGRWHHHHHDIPTLLFSSTQFNLDTISSTIIAGEERTRRRVNLPSSNHRNQSSRRKPPLVDSELLRFLNTTQTLWNTNDDESRCNIENIMSDMTIINSNYIVNDARAVNSKNNETISLSSSSSTSSSFIDSSRSLSRITTAAISEDVAFVWNADDQMMQQWMKQYECTYIVALLHQKYGAALEAAFAVGTTIERIAISRAQQKRMRSYCKVRNQTWKRDHGNMNQYRFDKNNNITGSTTAEINQLSADENATGDTDIDSRDDVCDILPFRTDCSNHNNMEEIVSVMREYGLSSKDICEILISSPSIAFMQPRQPITGTVSMSTTRNHNNTSRGSMQQSLQEILDRIFVGLLMGSNQPYELNLRKYDARKVLRNTPGILTVRGSEAAYQIIRLLINLGVSTNSLSRDKNNLPILLSRQPNDVFRLVAFLSSDAVRMPVTKIGPLLRRTEGQDLLNAIAPSRANMIAQRRMVAEPSKQKYSNQNILTLYDGLLRGTNSKSTSPAYVATQIQKVVINDMYRRMSETAWTLRNKIGTSDLGRVIAAYPSVLLLDAHRQILPTAQYLMNELDILPNDLPSILQLYPALLRTDVEQMRNVVSYLTSLAVAEDNLGTIFRSFPVLLTLDIEHDMEPVVDFLKSIGVSNVGRFISRLPPILGYSVETELRPKFEYLNSISSDARFKITKFPAYFSYPLERVIKSRFEYLRNVKRIPTPLLSLDHVLCSGDKDFATKVCQDANVTQYAKFMQDRQDAIRTRNNSLRQSNNIDATVDFTKVQKISTQVPLKNTIKTSEKSFRDTTTYTLPPVNVSSPNEQPSFPSGTAAAITS